MKKIVGLLILGGLIVFFSYFVAYIFGNARIGWWLTNFLHFSGGFYAVFFLRAVFYLTGKYHQTKTAWWMELTVFICGALVLGVLWEWYEFIFIFWDKVFVLHQEQKTLAIYIDTMSDLFIDFLGAIAAGVYLTFKYEKNK